MVKSEFRTDRQGTVDRPEEADRVRSDFTGFAAEDCIAVRERTVPGTVKHRTALRIVSRRITFGIDFTLPSLIRKADPPLFDVVGITFPIDSQVNMAVPKSNDRSLCDIGAFPVEREIANRQSFALLSQEKHQTPVCDEFSATARRLLNPECRGVLPRCSPGRPAPQGHGNRTAPTRNTIRWGFPAFRW